MDIKKLTGITLTLAQRLAGFDPTRHSGEVMASHLVGEENLNQNTSLKKIKQLKP